MRKQKNRLTSLLSLPDKGQSETSGPNGVLTRLFRKILADLDIGPKRFDSLLEQFIRDSFSGKTSSPKVQTSMRGNLMKEFIKRQMTWKVFCKALLILQVVEFQLALKIKRRNGSESTHSLKMEWGADLSTEEMNTILEQPPEAEEPGEYIPMFENNLSLEMEHWYIWNPVTKVVYEDVGELNLAPFAVPETIPHVKETLKKWRELDKMTLVSIGLRIHTLAETLYDGPPPGVQENLSPDHEGPANG